MDSFTGICPEADAYRTNLYARAMHRACKELGGIDALAQHLGVSLLQVNDWLTGISQPPEKFFLQAVGVIVGHRQSV